MLANALQASPNLSNLKALLRVSMIVLQDGEWFLGLIMLHNIPHAHRGATKPVTKWESERGKVSNV